MHGHVSEARVDNQSESQAKNTKQDANHQQPVAVDAEKQYLRQVGKPQAGLAAGFMSGLGKGGGRAVAEEGKCDSHRPRQD